MVIEEYKTMDEYNHRDNNAADHIKIDRLGTTHVEFTYQHTDMAQPENSFSISGVAENTDIDSSEALDPAREGNKTARFVFADEVIKLSLLLPIEPTDYIGIEYTMQAADKPKKHKRLLKWKYRCGL